MRPPSSAEPWDCNDGPQRRWRGILKWLWVHALFVSGLLWWAKRRLARQGAIVVLTFHRVLNDTDLARTNSQAGIVVRERTFDALLAYANQHYAFVDLDGAPDFNERNLRLAMTFDDGWIDTYTTALPITRRHGIPFAVFVCPSLVGRTRPFWPEQVVSFWRTAEREQPGKAAKVLSTMLSGAPEFPSADAAIEWMKQMPSTERGRLLETMQPEAAATTTADATMTWEQMSTAVRAGMHIGSHTLTHQILPRLPAVQGAQELRDSKCAIESRLGRRCVTLAYPNGDYCSEVCALTAAAGYERAFTTRPGAWTRDSEPLALPRINIWEGKLCDRRGRFSALWFDYAVFWTAYRGTLRRADAGKPHPDSAAGVAASGR